MGIFDFFKRKNKHLIRMNGVCEIYDEDDGSPFNIGLRIKFNLSNGMLDGTYERYYDPGVVSLSMNFKQGKLDGECSQYSPLRKCFEYKEIFKDGVLISRQGIRKIEWGVYELGPVINDASILKERGSSIKRLDLEREIDCLREAGVNFKLLA